MRRPINTPSTEPTNHQPDRDAIGRARTLTPDELGQLVTDAQGVEIRRMGFRLADMNVSRRRRPGR